MRLSRNIKAFQAFLLASSLVMFSAVWFTGSIFAASLPEEMTGIIREKTVQGVAYMTGGVGIGEREAMENWGKNYNLKLSFAEKSGVYLADVDVVVEDRNGNEKIKVMTNGPWFYLQLPPGAYTVKATFDGETKQIKNMRLPSGDRVTRVMRWDLEEEFPIYARMETR
ncbi:MAG: carboxypeptidase-like regulatory domain-containing protein [Candidatus Binatia bacterium]